MEGRGRSVGWAVSVGLVPAHAGKEKRRDGLRLGQKGRRIGPEFYFPNLEFLFIFLENKLGHT
jgi:hypothetical protein